jgi:ferredoxin
VKRIVIDSDRCTGNGRCYALAPTLFTDDDRGYGQVAGDGVIGDDQLEVAQDVVLACPEEAVSMEDV